MDGEVDLLGERIAEQAAHLDAATHLLLANLREFDARGGWHLQGAKTCAHWLSWRVGWDLITARQRVLVARKLGEFSATDDALRRGELSYSKARAILRVATPANEAFLLDCARLSTASQLENLTRKYARVQAHDKDASPRDDEQRRYVRKRDTYDGMVKIEAVLHPEEAELVWAMLDHAAKHQTREPLPASALDDSAASDDVPTRAAGTTSGEGCGTDDSAASCDVPTTTAAATSGEGCGADDSAASCAVASVTDDSGSMPGAAWRTDDLATSGAATTTTARAPSGVGCGPDDSAASCAVASVTDDLGSMPGIVCHTEGSAASDAVPTTTAGALSGAGGGTDDSAASCAVASVTQPGTQLATAPARRPSVLQQAADARKHAFNRADALLAVAQSYLRGARPNRTPVDVMVTIPLSNLRAGIADAAEVLDAGLIGDSCISAETVRRLSCDAGVIEVMEDEHGVPLSVGRKRRTISGSIKRALLRRDKTCSFPGCANRVFLEAHHVRHWADGGETSLLNTALLCTFHHHFVHEYGYTIELDADQRPRFHDSHGRLVAAIPARSSTPDLGWPRIRAENQVLAIDAETFACEWDGTPMPYGTLVGQLARIDGIT